MEYIIKATNGELYHCGFSKRKSYVRKRDNPNMRKTEYTNFCKNDIMHYGVKGMHWGIRKAYYKTGEMTSSEYARACDLWKRIPEFPGLSKAEKERTYENFDNNLSDKERTYSVVTKTFDRYRYTAIHKGHNEYKIIDRERIEPPRTWDEQLDDILTEVVGKDWRRYDW